MAEILPKWRKKPPINQLYHVFGRLNKDLFVIYLLRLVQKVFKQSVKSLKIEKYGSFKKRFKTSVILLSRSFDTFAFVNNKVLCRV